MEKENLEYVLSEILEELKESRRVIEERNQLICSLQKKVEAFEQKLDSKKLVAPTVDTREIQAEITVGIARIKQIVSEQPKNVIQERRFILFPEHNAREYFRVFFRLILWLTIAVSCLIVIASIKQAIENHKEIKLKQIEINHFKKAWEYMYVNESKSIKKKMDAVWQKAWQTE